MQLTSWLSNLIDLPTLTAYLECQGWQQTRRANSNFAVFVKEGVVFDDGAPVQIVLLKEQIWDWPTYRQSAIGLLAAVEGRNEANLVAGLLTAAGLNVDELTKQFKVANPPDDCVPF